MRKAPGERFPNRLKGQLVRLCARDSDFAERDEVADDLRRVERDLSRRWSAQRIDAGEVSLTAMLRTTDRTL